MRRLRPERTELRSVRSYLRVSNKIRSFRLRLRPSQTDPGAERIYLRRERANSGPERTDMRAKRADLIPGKANLRPE